MDTFVDSAWYWWRYLSPHKTDGPIDREMADRWTPVDQYTGGAEHAVMHLLYARFFCKALADLGLVREREPFRRLFNQGQILGADGERMSKSRGNVQAPDELVATYGADTVRLFLMFMGPWDQGGPWNPSGINGIAKFLDRVWRVTLDPHGRGRTNLEERAMDGPHDARTERALRVAAQRTLRDVTAGYESFRFNTIVAHLMELTNLLVRARGTAAAGTPDWSEAVRLLLLMLAPIAPHISEELWSRRLADAGDEWRSIHLEQWPSVDEAAVVAETIEVVVQVNGKVRDRVEVPAGISEIELDQIVMARDKVRAALAGRDPDRIIRVGGKLVNLVVRAPASD
jgi:leucyl-tRNA synthetase